MTENFGKFRSYFIYICIVRCIKIRKILIIDVDRYKQLMVILNVLGPGKWKMSEDETGF